MAFSSIEFLWFFMPAVLVLYALVPPGGRSLLLAPLSLLFYAWGAHSFVVVLLVSIAFNYWAGLWIGRLRARGCGASVRRVMWAAIAMDLGILFTWKYVRFAIGELDGVLGWLGVDRAIGRPSIALPIGISFLTFHAISYVVDTARGTASPMRRLRDFAQYMAFFPQLVAGPIIRYHEIDEQIRSPSPRGQRLSDLGEGFPRFALGLVKKVLIADQVSPIADAVFAGTQSVNTPAAWLGALAFTVQIYFDFSGYSDMAIGLGRMFGFRFPENFARPYSSVSVTDFWRRWHMTLSRWFRDYVYVPLGGSRRSVGRTCLNLLFVFLLTGLWHGAAWTFVLWGLYYGVLLVIERLTGIARWPDERLAPARRVVTLLLVVLGWVLFRAHTLADAGRIYAHMLPADFGGLPPPVGASLTPNAACALLIGLASVLVPRGLVLGRVVLDGWWAGRGLAARLAVLVALPLAAVSVAAGSFRPFLYFRF